MRLPSSKWVPAAAILAALVVVVVAATRDRGRPTPRPAPVESIGSLGVPVADPAGLANRIATLEAQLAQAPDNHAAGIALAEALVRQARVTGNGAYAARGEQRLRQALASDPGDYDAQRMLGVVLLSLHKFEDAVVAGQKARDRRPDDAFNYGVIGDGQLELGKYREAFASFQRMVDLRPSAASYARAAYAQELQGNLEAALETMQRAVNATSPRDAEGLAWALTQTGDLLFRLDRLAEAEAHYRGAARVFPNHPYAIVGQAHIYAARHQDADAIDAAGRLLQQAPSMRLAAFVGDLHARHGRTAEAERYYAMAEAIGRDSASTDDSLAGFLAERDRKLEEALVLAERAGKRRQDVHTLDALAWTYFRNGRLREASDASSRALATGTRDRRVVLHAAAIKAAAGDASGARALRARAALRDPDFDVIGAGQVMEMVTAPKAVATKDMRASK